MPMLRHLVLGHLDSWWEMYGWWNLLIPLPLVVGLAVWLWLSPTVHRVPGG